MKIKIFASKILKNFKAEGKHADFKNFVLVKLRLDKSSLVCCGALTSTLVCNVGCSD